MMAGGSVIKTMAVARRHSAKIEARIDAAIGGETLQSVGVMKDHVAALDAQQNSAPGVAAALG